MRRFFREPLIHFLLLGALLFAVYGWSKRDAVDEDNRIVVTPGVAAGLQSQFERVWQRAPSPQEMQGLVDGWVREEMLYREGLRAGLSRDDPVVRRRVAQKMQFMTDAALAEPAAIQERAYSSPIWCSPG